MIHPEIDARRTLVRERHEALALDALRPEPPHSTVALSTGRGRRSRLVLRWPEFHLRRRAAPLGGDSRPISVAANRQVPQGGGQQ
jgi:hypothetical protein